NRAALRERLWGREQKNAEPPSPQIDADQFGGLREELDVIRQCLAELALRPVSPVEENIDPPPISIATISKAVSAHYGVTRLELCSQRRLAKIARPRQVAFWLCRHLTSRSYPEIGRRFGDKDHTTVLHGVRKMEAVIPQTPELQEDIAAICKALR